MRSEEGFHEAVEFIGPFEQYAVTVDGYRVPMLQAHMQKGGKVLLTLDHRYGLDLDLQTAQFVVPFVANAMAVAAGYSCHGENSVPLNRYKTQMHGIEFGQEGNEHG